MHETITDNFERTLRALGPKAHADILHTLEGNDPILVQRWLMVTSEGQNVGCLMMNGHKTPELIAQHNLMRDEDEDKCMCDDCIAERDANERDTDTAVVFDETAVKHMLAELYGLSASDYYDTAAMDLIDVAAVEFDGWAIRNRYVEQMVDLDHGTVDYLTQEGRDILTATMREIIATTPATTLVTTT